MIVRTPECLMIWKKWLSNTNKQCLIRIRRTWLPWRAHRNRTCQNHKTQKLSQSRVGSSRFLEAGPQRRWSVGLSRRSSEPRRHQPSLCSQIKTRKREKTSASSNHLAHSNQNIVSIRCWNRANQNFKKMSWVNQVSVRFKIDMMANSEVPMLQICTVNRPIREGRTPTPIAINYKKT